MKENRFYEGGKKEYKKELKLQRDEELKEVDELLISKEGKQTLIVRIKSRFRKLLRQSDDSLFLSS